MFLRGNLNRILSGALVCALPGIAAAQSPQNRKEPGVRKIHLIQDDAQDYMVSKIYRLKYTQATDLEPFVTGMVMRYNMNSTVNTIEYGTQNGQLLTVTCPVEMMPCVDDFVAKADRNIPVAKDRPGEIIKGTGITRAVYRPLYRSGQNLLNVLVNSVIGEGPWGSVYGWDANSNQIYWKDNASNTQFVYQFLGYLDRPAPQIAMSFKLYEIRESTLRDMGIEYLAWKNGPGLNIFETGFKAFSVSSAGSAAVQAISGPAGGFFFAPQFDASFIRLLQQSGKAEITNTANITAANSDSSETEIYFNPGLQNIVKDNNDQTSVQTGLIDLPEGFQQTLLVIRAPIVNLHYGSTQSGYPENLAFSVNNYNPGTYAGMDGTLFFAYEIASADTVDRNNLGDELIDFTSVAANITIQLNKETVLAQWNSLRDVEQTIGVPWLSDIPYLKYLFSTTTHDTESVRVCLTVKASMLDTGISTELPPMMTGELFKIPEKP